MVSLIHYQSFRNTLVAIHSDIQKMATQTLKLEPSIAGQCRLDSQTQEYKLSDLDNSLKDTFAGQDIISLNSGREWKLTDTGAYECEYSLSGDNCPVETIQVGLTEFGGEIEVYLHLVFMNELYPNFILNDSEFNRLMA